MDFGAPSELTKTIRKQSSLPEPIWREKTPFIGEQAYARNNHEAK
jgi:hypothetical protein